MSQTVRRRRFERVLIWQPASGTIIDLPTRYVLPLEGPAEEETYSPITTGSKRPVQRSQAAQVPVTQRELALMGEVLQRTKCPVKAAFFGGRETDNWMWLEETRLQVVDPGVGSGVQAEKVLDLENGVFYPAIWESTDLIGGIPWQGTTAQTAEQFSGDPLRLEPKGQLRPGYLGPGWEVQKASDAVDMAGNATLGSGATLTFQFPAWGATLRVEPLEKFSLGSISIIARDFSGNSLAFTSSTGTAELTLPVRTWEIELSVGSSTCRPRLFVKDPSVPKFGVIRAGQITPDCSKASSPNYTTLPTPNTSPDWVDKESLAYGLTNTDPTFTKSTNYEVSSDLTGTTNQAPTFTQSTNYKVSEDETTVTYSAPTIGATSAIYTASFGFSEIVWPGLGYTNFADNAGNGELAVDEDQSYIFVAESNGLFRYDLSGGSRTLIGGNDPFGVAVDHLSDTVYWTEAGSTGIYSANYDGTGSGKVTGTSEAGYSLAVAPDTGSGGYIFAAYEDELLRFNLSGKFKKVLDSRSISTNQSEDIRPNVHVDLNNADVFYGTQTVNTSGSTTYTDKVKKLPFSGGSPTAIFSRSQSSFYPSPNNWTILQDEAKFVRVQEKEGADADVITRNLDGSGKTTKGTVSNADTGERIASSQPVS